MVETYNDLQDHIFIPSKILCAYLDRAEDRESAIQQDEVWLKLLKASVKMRRRESIPLEELQSDRETRFLQDEQRTSKRSMRDDSSHLTSSSPEADSS